MMEQGSNYTKGEYKKLCERIRKNPNNVSKQDYEMLQNIRLTYRYPLYEIFTYLNKVAQKIDRKSICTYRIKRIESIISKLQRFNNMVVYKMNDIAGCRCIMTSDKEVIKLCKQLEKNEENIPFKFELRNDYINKPKESGYRSIHLKATLKSNLEKVIEIQIRSLEQHNWATLVEISDLLFLSKLKEYGEKGDPILYNFHKLLAKKDNDLSLYDKRNISKISGEFHYIEKLGALFFQNNLILREQRNKIKFNKGSFYFLISTDTEGKPELRQFRDFNEAEKEYFEMFLDNSERKNIVLTHFKGTSFDKISIAYSNYVMTYNATLFKVLKAISEVSVHAFNHYNIYEFKKYYKAFWYIISKWFEIKIIETDSYLKNKKLLDKSIKKNKEWSFSIVESIENVYEIIKLMTSSFKTNILYFPINMLKSVIDKKYKRTQLFFKEYSKLPK